MAAEYMHIGIPVLNKKPNMVYNEWGGFWVNGSVDAYDYKIEYLKFEEGTRFPEILSKQPHVAYKVDNMDPYLKEAQREHDAFADCLRQQGVEVVYLRDLVAESITDADVRADLIRQFLEESGVKDDRLRESLEDFLSALPDKEMVSAMMAGVRKSQLRANSARLGDYLSAAGDDYPFAVDPLPNLYFTRDPFATIGTGVSIHKMHTVTRNRETLFGRFIFEHIAEAETVVSGRRLFFPNQAFAFFVKRDTVIAVLN